MANWSKSQLECLRRVYVKILTQPSQLDNNGFPTVGSRMQTLHRNAYAITKQNNADPVDPQEAAKKLTEMFAQLEPTFVEEFTAPERVELFTSLSHVVAAPENRQSAPYNVPATGLLY
ncbi:MAG: hypothetical protein JNK05_12345 [Myxococcales bacterium]|nr:hypothetical protein [Myxococcales bacterium]